MLACAEETGHSPPLLRNSLCPASLISSPRLFKFSMYNLAKRQSRGEISWFSAKPCGVFPPCQRDLQMDISVCVT